MDHTSDFQKMLELMPGPAFTAAEGSITCCNREARGFLIEPGMPIDSMLLTGSEEYAQLQDGCLYLTLNIDGVNWGASVTRLEDQDLFRLEQERIPTELNAMALVCSELRYPISNLSLLAKRLLSNVQDQNGAAAANHELNKVLRILNNASNAERFSKDRSQYQQERDICSVLEEFLAEAATLLEQAGITLRYELPQHFISTMLDWPMLKQAMYAMLDNAAKVTEPGGSIDVSLTLSGKFLRLSVTDYGSGIPQAIRGSIFSRYARQPGVEEGQQSVGLGMVLVRSTALAHGGTVLVDQPDGAGTRVTVTFAIRQQSQTTLRSQSGTIVSSPDDALVMLSNVLPKELYAPKNK